MQGPPAAALQSKATMPAVGKKRRNLILGSSVVALAAVIGLVVYLLIGRSFTASGTFTLFDYRGFGGAGGLFCSGSGGYDDIREGAQVIIRDEAGTTVGVGELVNPRTAGESACTFSFTIHDVPSGADFYEVEVTSWGGISYTQAELEEGVALSLGQ